MEIAGDLLAVGSILLLDGVNLEDLLIKGLIVLNDLSFKTLIKEIFDIIHIWENFVADVVHEINFALLDDKNAILDAVNDKLVGVLLVLKEVLLIHGLSVESLDKVVVDYEWDDSTYVDTADLS